jgi:carnosine N-methyltransferase
MEREVARRERSWSGVKQLLGAELIDRQVQELRHCAQSNQQVFTEMLKCNEFVTSGHTPVKMAQRPDLSTEIRNLSKVRSTLHQCAREWSSEGMEERKKTFEPLLDYLEAYVPRGDGSKTVLVPGSGLGRLVAEVVGRGYTCQGNEVSYQMLLMSEFLLNELQSSRQRVIYPWIHNPSNVADFADLTRPVHIPDTSARELLDQIPVECKSNASMSMAAGEFEHIYGKQTNCWDAVITCFFIDTAPNILDYLKIIHNTLKPGGVWINGGPLLWHWQSSGPKITSENGSADPRYAMSTEISYDVLRALIEKVGFEIKDEKWDQVGYTSNIKSMLRSVYTIVQFVAVKK